MSNNAVVAGRALPLGYNISLVISRVFCETDPKGIIELFADTAVSKRSLHDLIM
jgi:hypothetical protein